MPKRLPRVLAVLALLLGAAAVAPAQAAALLEIVVTQGGATRSFELDREAFEALPRSELVTTTPWTEGDARFSGVLLSDLLTALELPVGDVAARALNDYEARIPASDIESYDVLIADRLNGEPMPIRDKGPLWIIYPLSDEPALRSADTEAKMVWQLFRLTLD